MTLKEAIDRVEDFMGIAYLVPEEAAAFKLVIEAAKMQTGKPGESVPHLRTAEELEGLRLNGPVLEMPAGMKCTAPKLYAITVTDGDRSVRYEAPTLEEVRRLAGDSADDTVEIVTLTEAKK